MVTLSNTRNCRLDSSMLAKYSSGNITVTTKEGLPVLVNSNVFFSSRYLVSRVSFHTGTGNIVPRLVTDLTDFFGENKEFSMILGKNWNFKVVFD